ncbi:MAG: fused MFS/spermidine synthase [Candidatus Binatia bacterium]
MQRGQAHSRIAFNVFVVSMYGMAAATSLAYEVVWIKILALIFGMSSIAVGTVFGVFFTGIGLGGLVTARFYPKDFPALKLFGLVQLVLGGYALALPTLLRWADGVYTSLAPAMESGRHVLLRIVGSATLLLVPCVLMGSVFPLLSRMARSISKEVPSGLGLLYFVGVVGSAAGAFTTGLIFLPQAGLNASIYALGILNLSVGGLTLGSSRLSSFVTPDSPLPSPSGSERTCDVGILTAAAIVGLALFGAEIVWIKLVWLVVDSTAYAEAVVVGTVLLAMAAGSGLYLLLRRWRVQINGAFVSALFAIALFQLLLLPTMSGIAAFFDRVIHQGGWIGSSLPKYLTAQFLLVLFVAGIPSVGYGFLFPCLCELAAGKTQPISSQIGRLYAWHNWGSVVGSLLAAFVIIPLFGLGWTLIGVSWVLLAVAYWHTGSFFIARMGKAVARGSVALLALAAIPISTIDVTYRDQAAGDQKKVVFHYEDGFGVVEVYEDRGTGYRSLLSSRLRQEGGNHPEQVYVARMQGYLPLLLHPRPARILVIGLGTGISLGPFLAPEVREITTVEISKGVIEAASLFVRDNKGVLRSPKARILHQDGRNFIKLTRGQYDLIMQDLFFPYRSGVGSLYALEHYLACRKRLAKGGLMAQWVAVNQVGPDDLRSIVGTLNRVFPHVSLWLNGGYLLILGGESPIQIDFPSFVKRFGRGEVLKDLGLVGDPDLYDLLGTFVSAGRAVKEWVNGAAINTDDNAYIEYRTPLYFQRLNTVELAVENVEGLVAIKTSLVALVKGTEATAMKRLEEVDRAHVYLLNGVVLRARGDLEAARQWYQKGYSLNQANYQLRTFLKKDLFERGHQALLDGNWEEAERLLDRALAIDPQFVEALFDRALIYARLGKTQQAVALYRKILARQPTFSRARFNLGVSLYHLGHYEEAAAAFAKVTQKETSSADAHFNLANSLVRLGRYREAGEHYRRALFLDPNHPHAQENLREILTWLGSNRSSGGP